MLYAEQFTSEEESVLRRFFTNTDQPVFALVNLPEVVKGALFARYSRSPKSLRRLFLDEFHAHPQASFYDMSERVFDDDPAVGVGRAEQLYERVFNEYGDDSVAQLGGAHLACEQSSNILTKVLEWGRLAAYLEQSTRYIFYDQKLDGRYRYRVPPEITGSSLEAEYTATMDSLFDTYSTLVHELVAHFEARFPRQPGDSNFIWRASIRAKACDAARGLLPASTTSNMGIYATGQAYEMMIIRMNAHPLQEVRDCAAMMLTELRKVIPSFLRRVDVPDRGGAWSGYMSDVAARMADMAGSLTETPQDVPEVSLVEWDPDAEAKVAAAALYAYSDLPDEQLLELVRRMPADERANIIRAYVGDRKNRRHKPGRGMERTYYRFDVLSDFGSFRDLQRHRMLTLEWQRLGVQHGYITPPVIDETGNRNVWDAAMNRMADLHGSIEQQLGADPAQYAVPFGYRLRYYMHLNAREAFHLLELRTAQQGHPDYRRVCQEMHRLIRDQAGHTAIADAMSYVDHNQYDLERLEAERRAAQKRAATGRSESPDSET